MVNFVFKPTTKTYSDPASATFRPGLPFGREYSRGDIALLHPEITSTIMYFNSKILREAMLSSADVLEEMLGIKVTDVNKKEDKKVEDKPAKTEKPKKEKEVVEEETKIEVPEEPIKFEEITAE